MRSILFLPLLLSLAACGMDPSGKSDAQATASATPAPAASTDPLASHDGDVPEPEDKLRPLMQAQVVLDRLGFTPGVVDGKEGLSTRNAVFGFQEANGLTNTGKLDPATQKALAHWSNITATRTVTVPVDFAAGPFAPLPHEPADQAKLPALGYQSLDEKLAERFHTTAAVLYELNLVIPPPAAPGAASEAPAFTAFRAGQKIRVPNVGGDRIEPGAVQNADWAKTLASLGVGSVQPRAEKIVVSKSKGTLKAYDGAGKLVAMFTATMGSSHDPLPLGDWKVKGTSYNPPFHYNPDLFWDASSTDTKQLLPPGPNGPVGVAWIDLTKDHYGIHGTPAPETIGRAESHGCVRLTNWDVARLAQMVKPGTSVLFES
jgi:lipoprotein-anchoring transpeptidase ErfK/SrfK